MLRHAGGPRPWLVCVHATEMGRPEVDRRLFRAKYLHEQLGLNVAMPVLPLHASRRPARGSGAFFPTLDVLDNVHGLAQAASDVRSVIAWVREQDATGIGILGISLGGYVTALVAGLEEGLDCVIAGMPVVDFPDVFRHNAPPEVRESPRFVALGDLSDALHQVVSPLRLNPATPVDRRFVFAGLADRLADPVRHAGRCGSTGTARRSTGSREATSATSSTAASPTSWTPRSPDRVSRRASPSPGRGPYSCASRGPGCSAATPPPGSRTV